MLLLLMLVSCLVVVGALLGPSAAALRLRRGAAFGTPSIRRTRLSVLLVGIELLLLLSAVWCLLPAKLS